jgi:uroporphyrinogen decarboxylase
MTENQKSITPRKRVAAALSHEQPDRTPVDFLAVPEIWQMLTGTDSFAEKPADNEFFDPDWEKLLQELQIDCRVISYDQFCAPPESIIKPGASIDWYGSLARSTPNRMWRQRTPYGAIYDIWGRHFEVFRHASGEFEELSAYPLGSADTVSDVEAHIWPEPDWWDFSGVPELLSKLDSGGEYHLRYRIGSIFEVAWQLYGLEAFLMALALNPEVPGRIMHKLTDVYVEITDHFLEKAGNRIDMVYFYDDIATQNSLLISKAMWAEYIRPHHARLIEIAKKHGKPVMYHSDGALYPLLPDLIELGIDLLNPVQTDASGMNPEKLKAEFGNRLSFHGGIDIAQTLPFGTPEEVKEEVQSRIKVLGKNGGYIMASSHHIQANTPPENVRAMYDPAVRKVFSSQETWFNG